jgi:hypothetical protein
VRVQHSRLFACQRLWGMPGTILGTVRVPLRSYKKHANDVLSGGPAGQPIARIVLRRRR